MKPKTARRRLKRLEWKMAKAKAFGRVPRKLGKQWKLNMKVVLQEN